MKRYVELAEVPLAQMSLYVVVQVVPLVRMSWYVVVQVLPVAAWVEEPAEQVAVVAVEAFVLPAQAWVVQALLPVLAVFAKHELVAVQEQQQVAVVAVLVLVPDLLVFEC